MSPLPDDIVQAIKTRGASPYISTPYPLPSTAIWIRRSPSPLPCSRLRPWPILASTSCLHASRVKTDAPSTTAALRARGPFAVRDPFHLLLHASRTTSSSTRVSPVTVNYLARLQCSPPILQSLCREPLRNASASFYDLTSRPRHPIFHFAASILGGTHKDLFRKWKIGDLRTDHEESALRRLG